MSEEVKKPLDHSLTSLGHNGPTIRIHTKNLGISAEEQAKIEQAMLESLGINKTAPTSLMQEIQLEERKAKIKKAKRAMLMKQKKMNYVEPWKQARDQLEKAMGVLENEYSRVAANAAYTSFKLFLRSKLDELEGETENPFFFDDAFQALVKGFGLDSFFGVQLVPDIVTNQELEQYQKFWRSIPTEWPFADDEDEYDEPLALFSPR